MPVGTYPVLIAIEFLLYHKVFRTAVAQVVWYLLVVLWTDCHKKRKDAQEGGPNNKSQQLRQTRDSFCAFLRFSWPSAVDCGRSPCWVIVGRAAGRTRVGDTGHSDQQLLKSQVCTQASFRKVYSRGEFDSANSVERSLDFQYGDFGLPGCQSDDGRATPRKISRQSLGRN